MIARRPPLFLLVLALPLLEACGDGKAAPADSVVAKEVAPLPVQVATLEPAPFTDSITLYGRVDAKERVRITAEIPGRIEGVPFSEGQTVGRGQTVARINARLMSAQVDQAAAAAELAEATFQRTKTLNAKQLASGADLEMARAQAAQSKAALEIARANLEKAVVRAPFEGQVTNVTAKVGELASPGVPLLEVVSLDHVIIHADVPERDISLLEMGSPVSVELEAYPGRSFEGNITEIGLVASHATRTFPVEVTLDNKERALRPGMLARIVLVRQRFDQVVVVPRDAVLDEVDGKSVYVVDGDTAHRRRVELGAARGRFALVRGGLDAGERLIVLGHRQVVDGQKVSVTKELKCCATEIADNAAEVPREAGSTVGDGAQPKKG